MYMLRKTLLLAMTGVGIAALIGGGSALSSSPSLPERSLGKSDAPVTVIEYASLTCDACKRFHTEILPRVKEAYLDTGKARLVYRHFPFDQAGLMAAILTECAPRVRFFGLVDTLFRSHDNWAHATDPKAGLAQIGRLAGIGTPAFEACLADDRLSTAIVEEIREGQTKHNVSSTPTFIIGDAVLRGVRSYEEIARAIDKATPR